MYSVKWDSENNIPVLEYCIDTNIRIQPPRPVFSTELDILGFNYHWQYPTSDLPLLWAIGRSYYYKGIEVAQVNGGNIYTKPKVEIIHKGELQPINISKLIEANLNSLIILESEAKSFINKIYKKRKRIGGLAVAYSGGKDSQVNLELVSQVIPPEDYFVIFTNTGMELPDTLSSIAKTRIEYQKKFPNLEFLIAEQLRDIYDNWNDFGPPSRLKRWCCSVTKSIPFYVLLSDYIQDKNVTVFEGVRRDESFNRSNYDRVAYSVKHTSVTNVRPILEWNDTEIYLYLFYKGINMNQAYKSGLTRVGCSLCPFSSDWSEYLISQIYPNLNDRFINEISKYFLYNGITDPIKQRSYIADGKWKTRGGDRCLKETSSSLEVLSENDLIKIQIMNPKSDLFEWIKIFDHYISRIDENTTVVQVKSADKAGRYKIINSFSKLDIEFYPFNDKVLDSYVMRLLNKVAFCVSCHACFVECPNKAIAFRPNFYIDQSKCIHCLNCLLSINKGCLIADSRSISSGGEKMNNGIGNLDKYSTFGLRECWLVSFLNDILNWEQGLGSKQVIASKRWFFEAELLSKDKHPTVLYSMLKNLKLDDVWGIIWVNLCINSGIVRWFHLKDYRFWDRQDLLEILKTDFPNYSDGTLNNPLSALINTLDSSSILSETLGQGIIQKKGRSIVALNRKGTSDISDTVLIYALYRFAEKENYYTFTTDDLFKDEREFTLHHIFGITKKNLKTRLISIQEHRSRLIRVEFNANLDNIFLIKNYLATEALEVYLEGK